MPDETRKPIKKPGGWSAVKPHIKDWNSAQLIALIKDLYDRSSDNRSFVDARLQADDPRHRLGFPRFHHRCRRAT